MADRQLPSIDDLSQLIQYDPGTGGMVWKVRPASMFRPKAQSSKAAAASWNAKWAGKPALNARHNEGYRVGAVYGKLFLAHRVAFALHHGRWPRGEVDHINGMRDDNRAMNLRDVTRLVNRRNLSRSSKNTSGITGVCWDATRGKWKSSIQVKGRTVNLGRFDNMVDAAEARKSAELEYGFHENHGKQVAI